MTGYVSAVSIPAPSRLERQEARVRDETHGRLGHVLQTSDFDRDYQTLTTPCVRRREAWSTVAGFNDSWRSKWDLVQPIRAAAAPT